MSLASQPVDPLFNAKSFEAQIGAIRETAKWQALALSGIVALLIGGMKIVDLPAPDSDHYLFALAVSAVAFVAVVIAMYFCCLVLAERRPSLPELLDEKELYKQVASGPVLLLEYYGDIQTLRNCYRNESERFAHSYLMPLKYPDTFIMIDDASKKEEHDAAKARLLECRVAVYEVLSFAHLLRVQACYGNCQRVLCACFFFILLMCTLLAGVL